MSPAPAGPGSGPGTSKPPAPSPFTGRTLARCKVGERLGRGATSQVFRAFYEPLGKDIALKILAKEAAGSEELRKRFLSEARSAAKLSHENIVKVLDVVEDQGFLCILMEYVGGPTLQDRLDDEKVLPPRHALQIAAQMARALEAAHEAGIVHRDVKPANVMLVGRPGEETVKVVDFGLAAQQEMNRVGTPLFMSPEAAQGKRIDEKSDVYALGVCLYRMLTGALPFTGTTVKEILAAHVNDPLIPPSQRLRSLGPAYDDILKKLLVKSKGYRPAAGDAADALEDLADDLEEREKGVRRVRRRKKKKKPARAAKPNTAMWTGLAVAGVVVVIVAFLVQGSGPREEPIEAPPADAPKVVAVDPAQTAYEDARAFFASNPANPEEAVRRFQAVERHFPGTKWATLAIASRGDAQRAAEEKRKADDARQEERRKLEEEARRAANDPAAKYAKLEALARAFDFSGASAVAESFDEELPPGVGSKEWDHRMARLSYLQRNWVDRVARGLSKVRKPIPAKDVFPDAKAGEMLVGANSGGAVLAVGSDKRTMEWAKANPEALFKKGVLPDGALNTEEFESNVILAAVAAELGQEAALKRFLGYARGFPDDDGTNAEQLRRLFGE